MKEFNFDDNPKVKIGNRELELYVFDADVLVNIDNKAQELMEAYKKLVASRTTGNIKRVQDVMKEYVTLLMGEEAWEYMFYDYSRRHLGKLLSCFTIISNEIKKIRESSVNESVNE